MVGSSDIHSEFNELIDIVDKSDISSIKDSILRLIAVINDPQSSALDLTKILERDPPLSAKILKLANSTYYGLNRKINNIQEAIVTIGFNKVRELSLNQTVFSLYNKTEIVEGYSRVALWKHSVAVALCNKLIYMREFRETGENAYTAGLLLDIGIIIEDQFLKEEFVHILIQSKKDKCNLHDAEGKILGFDHTDIGRTLADKWNFPMNLVTAISNHHEPDSANDKFKKIALTSYISGYICKMNEIGYCDAPYADYSLYTRFLEELKIQEMSMDLLIKDTIKEIEKMDRSGWFHHG